MDAAGGDRLRTADLLRSIRKMSGMSEEQDEGGMGVAEEGGSMFSFNSSGPTSSSPLPLPAVMRWRQGGAQSNINRNTPH